MEIEYSPSKNASNIEKHGVCFEQANNFEFETAMISTDKRKNYGETRYTALGFISDRLHHMTYTIRAEKTRIISLRKANNREKNHYAKIY